MKRKLRLFLFLSIIISFFVIRCDNDSISNKENMLTEINNKFNETISKKDWEELYEYFKKSRREEIFKSKVNQKSFVSDSEQAFVGSNLKVETINSKSKDKSGVTKNLITTRFIIPSFTTIQDTVYHFWVYKNNKWFIEDWDIRLSDIKSELEDSSYNLILKSFFQD